MAAMSKAIRRTFGRGVGSSIISAKACDPGQKTKPIHAEMRLRPCRRPEGLAAGLAAGIDAAKAEGLFGRPRPNVLEHYAPMRVVLDPFGFAAPESLTVIQARATPTSTFQHRPGHPPPAFGNAIGKVRTVQRNVKRWKVNEQKGELRVETSHGILEAQKTFRRLKAYRQRRVLDVQPCGLALSKGRCQSRSLKIPPKQRPERPLFQTMPISHCSTFAPNSRHWRRVIDTSAADPGCVKTLALRRSAQQSNPDRDFDESILL